MSAQAPIIVIAGAVSNSAGYLAVFTATVISF